MVLLLKRAAPPRRDGLPGLLEAIAARDDRGALAAIRSEPDLAVPSTGASGTKGTGAEQLAIVALLLEHDAKKAAKDAKGKTPADLARNPGVIAALEGGEPGRDARRQRRKGST